MVSGREGERESQREKERMSEWVSEEKQKRKQGLKEQWRASGHTKLVVIDFLSPSTSPH